MCVSKIASETGKIKCAVVDIICCLQNFFGELNEDILFELKVILNELILNAVKHGNNEQLNKSVTVVTGVTEKDYVFFIVEDEGKGYDYRRLFDDTGGIRDICDIKETGRGMMIVNSLCDRIRFNSRGNKVVVLKKICRNNAQM